MQYLADQLKEYEKSGVYPFHMPGHKRKKKFFPEGFGMDITEIDGFDNLHHAAGILKEAQERAAELYGSKRCFYLVNGSTCGLLAAICAATKKGERVLVARNSHKAVYHALFLNELKAEYLYPAITESGIQGQITAEQVEAALKSHPDIAAVVITSPTYEGIISDIRGIAAVVHRYGIPFIVDEAHGAHLGFGGAFPENAVKLGADAVIMSLHKTLPSFTQTALLHICSDRISEEKAERYLGIFETSSPSYLFMAGMDQCIRMLSEEGKQMFSDYRQRLDRFYRETSDLKYLHVMNRKDLSKEEAYEWDDSKLVIFSGGNQWNQSEKLCGNGMPADKEVVIENTKFTGEELHQKLLSDYRLQMEMVSGFYVLGMTSLLDDDEGFYRLNQALHEIDQKLQSLNASEPCCYPQNIEEKTPEINTGKQFMKRMYERNPVRLLMHEAMQRESMEVLPEKAVGKVAAESIYLYPPGIPMIVPGEMITENFIENVRECEKLGLCVEGGINLSKNRIKIVYF